MKIGVEPSERGVMYRRLMTTTIIACAIIVGPAASPSMAQSLEDAFKSWAAFECAALAGVAKRYPNEFYDFTKAEFTKAEGRLLEIGYSSGKRIIEKVRSGVISSDELKKETPAVLSESWDGPSIDFVLGRWLENAATHAHKRIRDASKTFDWTQESSRKAADFYCERNCRSVGLVVRPDGLRLIASQTKF